MPGLRKAFLEQALRQRFAFGADPKHPDPELRGRSARVVVTMGMPAWIERGYFRAHSPRSPERNLLRFSGIRAVRSSLVGPVEASARHRERWRERLRALGRRARSAHRPAGSGSGHHASPPQGTRTSPLHAWMSPARSSRYGVAPLRS